MIELVALYTASSMVLGVLMDPCHEHREHPGARGAHQYPR
jgi:hypothetical protein